MDSEEQRQVGAWTVFRNMTSFMKTPLRQWTMILPPFSKHQYMDNFEKQIIPNSTKYRQDIL